MSTLFSTGINWTHPSLSWSLDASTGHIIGPGTLFIRSLAHPAIGKSLEHHSLLCVLRQRQGEWERCFSVQLLPNFCLSCQMCPPQRNNTLTPPAAAVSAAECHLLGNGWFPPWKINRSHSQWQRFLWEEALHRDKKTGSLRVLHQQQSVLLSPAVPVGLDKSLHTPKPLLEAIQTTPPPNFCAAVPLMPRRDSHGN